MHEVSEPVAPARLLGQRRVDRALTAPPLRSNDESSLVAICCLLLKLAPIESRAFVKLVKHDHVTRGNYTPPYLTTQRSKSWTW